MKSLLNIFFSGNINSNSIFQ